VWIEASQAGDPNYNIANAISQSFYVSSTTVTLQSQTITFPAIANKVFTDAPFTLNATASSGLPVTYRLVSGPASLSGSAVTITGCGTVTLEAMQSGNSTFDAATPVQRSFIVNKANQTITFGALANKSFGDEPFTIAASASSGLAVAFRVVSGPAMISGNTVTITAAGVVTIEAVQAGNSN
jgi:hypothetical protein